MHIRPYVDLPESPDTGGASGAAGSDGSATGLAGPAASAPDLEPFARCGTGETAELPVVPAGPHAARGRGRGGRRDEADPATGSGPDAGAEGVFGSGGGAEPGVPGRRRAQGSGGGRRGRRRPGTVALAVAGVAAALGAGVLITQNLTDDGSGGHSLSTDDRALDGMPSSGPTAGTPSRHPHRDGSGRPSAAPDRTRDSDSASRADRDSGVHTKRDVGKSASSRPSGSGGGHGSAGSAAGASRGTGAGSDESHGGSRSGDPDGASPSSGRPGGETLRPGDSGSEVADLQRRLRQVGYWNAGTPTDGVYSAAVADAVERYQRDQGLHGVAYGDYDPATRQRLESQTAG